MASKVLFIKAILAILAFQVFSSPALASDWTYISSSNGTTVYLDEDSIIRDENDEKYVRYWNKSEFSPESGKEGFLVYQEITDCRNKSYSIITVTVYNKKSIAVRVMNGDYPKFTPITPDSIGEKKMEIACSALPRLFGR